MSGSDCRSARRLLSGPSHRDPREVRMTRLGCAIGSALLTATMATGCVTDAAPAAIGELPEGLATAPPPTAGGGQGWDLHEEICPRGGSRFRCYARIRVDTGGRIVTHAGREGLSP